MTLKFFKQGKPDTRMIEYDQAVVRLGLEKAKVEGEVEQKKNDLKQINVAYDLVRSVFLRNYEKLTEEEKKEIGEKTAVLFDYDKRVGEERKKLQDIILEQKKVKDLTEEKEQQVIVADVLFNNINEKRIRIEESISGLIKEKVGKEREKDVVASSLEKVKQETEKISKEFYSLSVSKVETEREIEKANRELKELNEIISILQTTNKQGLDLIASFAGERKRLQNKEEFLIRKEKDLAKYEERVEKQRKDAGISIPMIFK